MLNIQASNIKLYNNMLECLEKNFKTRKSNGYLPDNAMQTAEIVVIVLDCMLNVPRQGNS